MELRRTYRRLRSWPQTAAHHGITKPNGDPNPGLAFRIARRGYEPQTDECRQRIGLRPRAPQPVRMWDESLGTDPQVVAIVEWANEQVKA